VNRRSFIGRIMAISVLPSFLGTPLSYSRNLENPSHTVRLIPDKGYRVGEVIDLGDGEYGVWNGRFAILKGRVEALVEEVSGKTEPVHFNGLPGFGHD